MVDSMTKTQKFESPIEQNRMVITKLLSGAGTVKRLNNVNWLRHEISYTEPRTLFYVPNKNQQPYLDYNSMKNIGDAYDYIIHNPKSPIDATEVCRIHSMMCAGTKIHGGVFRSTPKVIEITVNGQRMHAPEYHEIPSRLNEIIFNLNNTFDSAPIRAFKVHYELIMLQPFDDFNKRMARMVMNWVLIQGGYRPIVFNHPSDKQKYKDAITAYANGNYKAYMSYMKSCMLRTQKEIIQVLTKSKIL